MGTYIEPFAFKKIFLNYFLGSYQLFIYALVIIYSYIAAKYQMPNMVFLILMVVIAIMFAAYIGESIYFLILLILGLVVFKAISAMIS